jgi:acyl transferase domain-containing protein/NADP-dependent 3-hydroxy acid dehydrogenase YdfG/acyl carrier protein
MENNFDIAIIGMSCRFPGADDLHSFWNNLVNGVESISHFTDDELKQSGIPDSLINNSNYIKAAPILNYPGMFDASFFGFTPMEAKTMDPQHRILLECAFEALDNSGYNPEKFKGKIGVYTGSAMNTYFMNNVLRSKFIDEYIPTLIGNDKDFLSTRISYKLNLKGPSLNVQTACSTSLVAVHLACQSLLSEESDMAIAGAVSVKAPHKAGYICDGGGIVSPDAHVRAFDAKANGTVFGSGCGIVVLKRLADATKDNDNIYAVIKGSAINNDGSEKAGYTAPSVNSQADAVIEALSLADINADSITYIEAHGSGTPLGDPIELTALTKAFRNFTNNKKYCAVGSVKTNVGHLDAAAGIAGLIKTVLSLKNKKIPPSLNYSEPNPEIDFENSPFFVNNKLSDWKSAGPRRAGVMSTGMGGTNAYLILEEAPESSDRDSIKSPNIFLLSAKNEEALNQSTKNLFGFLRDNEEVEINNVAYTLQEGRKTFNNRRFFVCKDKKEATEILGQENSKQLFTGKPISGSKRPVIFLFPGIGDHYVGMGYDLYHNVKAFKDEVDKCAQILNKYLDVDIRDVIYPKDYVRSVPTNGGSGIDLKQMLASRVNKSADSSSQKLNQTLYAQPALFTLEYALARLWINLGVNPDAIVGHSMGEYLAACLSGVISLEDTLKLIATRAKLVNNLPLGSMVAVTLPESEVKQLLNENVSISLINSPNLCVVAGSENEMVKFENELKQRKILYRQVQNAHAFHSTMLNPIVNEFTEAVKQVNLNKPEVPYTSNLTGNWITDNEAKSAEYWAKHSNHTARFSDGLEKAWQKNDPIFLEVGPGNTLSVLAMQHPESKKNKNPITVSSLRASYDNQSDISFFLTSAGKLWLSGVDINWGKLYEYKKPKRIPLPSYPFQKVNYWIDDKSGSVKPLIQPTEKNSELNNFKDWFYIPGWRRSQLSLDSENSLIFDDQKHWLIFLDEFGLGNKIKSFLEEKDLKVKTVKFKNSNQSGKADFIIDSKNSEDYVKLIKDFRTPDLNALNIIYLNCYSDFNDSCLRLDNDQIKYSGFYSLLFIAQALTKLGISIPVNLGVISSNLHQVTGDEKVCPTKALILGPCGVIPKEIPNVNCFNVDLLFEDFQNKSSDGIIQNLVNEFGNPKAESLISYRGKFRWIKQYDQMKLSSYDGNLLTSNLLKKGKLRKNGVYFITGGTGGIGLTIARYLAEKFQARLILTQKSELPEKSKWKKFAEKNPEDKILNQKLLRLIELEELGAEVVVHTAEAGDQEKMKMIIDKTVKQFGEINGVIHSAGIVKAGIIPAKEPEAIEKVFSPKINGTIILYDLVKNMNLDFFALCSSITAVITPYAEIDYSSANSFMDSFSNYSNSTNKFPTISINWPGWKEIGQLVNLKALKGTENWKEEALRKAILPADGLEAFKLAINSGLSQLIVSPESLDTTHVEAFPSQLLGTRSETKQIKTEEVSTNVVQEVKQKFNISLIEDKLSSIWKDILGVKSVSKEDDFFEMGGHSLLAIQLISAIRKSFNVDIELDVLFDASSLQGMSDKILNKINSNT